MTDTYAFSHGCMPYSMARIFDIRKQLLCKDDHRGRAFFLHLLRGVKSHALHSRCVSLFLSDLAERNFAFGINGQYIRSRPMVRVSAQKQICELLRRCLFSSRIFRNRLHQWFHAKASILVQSRKILEIDARMYPLRRVPIATPVCGDVLIRADIFYRSIVFLLGQRTHKCFLASLRALFYMFLCALSADISSDAVLSTVKGVFFS